MESSLPLKRFPNIPDDFKMILYMTLIDLRMIQYFQSTNLLQISRDKNTANTIVKLLLFESEGWAIGIREVNENVNTLFPFKICAIFFKEELIGVESFDGVLLFGVEFWDDFLDQLPWFFDASNEAEDQTNVIW